MNGVYTRMNGITCYEWNHVCGLYEDAGLALMIVYNTIRSYTHHYLSVPVYEWRNSCIFRPGLKRPESFLSCSECFSRLKGKEKSMNFDSVIYKVIKCPSRVTGVWLRPAVNSSQSHSYWHSQPALLNMPYFQLK